MRRLWVVAIIYLLFAWWGCSDSGVAPQDPPDAFSEAAPETNIHTGMAIGPIDGLTTAWHRVPANIPVPRGVTPQFRCYVPKGASVRWQGAEQIATVSGYSYARCPVRTGERETITVEVLYPDDRIETHSCNVRGMEFGVEDIVVTSMEVVGEPIELDENMSNEETMERFFGFSIAPIVEVGERHIRTSVNRRLQMSAKVDPPVFASLVEWRSNGNAVLLGAAQEGMLTETGKHTIDAGPPGRSPDYVVDTYRVVITSHPMLTDEISDGRLVTFMAKTEPPGFEDEIVWVSSTKYGQAEPTLGYGADFSVIFTHTWGPEAFQWLGVRAANAIVAQDGTAGLSICGLVGVNTLVEIAGQEVGFFPNGVTKPFVIQIEESSTNACAPLLGWGAAPGQNQFIEYCVEGDSLPQVSARIFSPDSGVGFPEGGTRYAGQCSSTYYANWGGVTWDPETMKLVCQVTALNWTNIITLPKWNPPQGTPPEQVAEWNRFLNALRTHELGHAAINDARYGAIETAMVNQAAGRFCAEIDSVPTYENGHPATAADTAIVAVITAALRAHIENDPNFTGMGAAHDTYDGPPPDGTNHGGTQGASLNPNP